MGKTLDPDDMLKAVGQVIGEQRREMREELDSAIREVQGAGDGGPMADIARQSMKSMATHLSEQKSLLVSVRRSVDTLARGPGKAPMSPRQVLVRSAHCKLIAFARKADPQEVVGEIYNGATRIADAIRSPATATKGITNPATTTAGGWAAELATPGYYAGTLASLAPASVYAQLLARGISIDLSGMGSMRFPDRVPPDTVPDCFIGEGLPIPVRALNFRIGGRLIPFKAGTISLYTGEIAKYSAPAAEAAISQGLSDDISLSIDARLVSDAAGDASHPAGLLNGAIEVTASTKPDLASAAVEDITALAAVIQPSALRLAFIASAKEAVALSLLFPGNAADIITTDALQPGEVIALDASDFVAMTAGDGDVSVVEDATLLSDDAPASADLMGGQTAKSLWQHNLFGIRVLESVSWSMRRPGRVAFLEGASW